ncbi:hypothetical protein [Yoonia sp.]|uniref:hypothetical protein n=1 Tax=Yoonia sp. TaxID=2212373 RepID=UPI002FD887C5
MGESVLHSKLTSAMLAAALVGLGASQAMGQSNDPALETALATADWARVATIASRMQADNPADADAAFLRALAAFENGDPATAASFAAQAYALAQTEPDRFEAARLAGRAHYNAGAFARSEFWFRRAANHTGTTAEATSLAADFRRAQQTNPLTIALGAWAAPSDNINDGSEDPYFQLEGLPFDFVLPAARRALSGIEYGAEARINYRLSQSARQRTSVGAYLLGQTYSLSSKAEGIAPELDGGDFAVGIAEMSFTHDRNFGAGLGPSSLTLGAGRIWYGGDPTWNYRTVSLQQGFVVDENSRLTLRFADTRQEAIRRDASVRRHDLEARYETAGGWNVVGGYTHSDGGFENVYDEYRIGGGVVWPEPVWNALWSGDITFGLRDYPTFTTTLDGRRDRFAAVSITATLADLSYWGFAPQIMVLGRTTTSTAEEFTTDALGIRFGIASTF